MSCPVPASTGVPVLQVIVIGAALVVSGVVLLLLTRRSRGGRALFSGSLLVFVAVLASGGHAPQARADTPACPVGAGPVSTAPASPAEAKLTVVQTSTMEGLAPGIAPVDITGIVTNVGVASTYVTDVTVRIAAVRAPNNGRCSAIDYVLLDTVMPFAQTLTPGESGSFAGAKIGFRDRAINQDSCQRAVITLNYVTS